MVTILYEREKGEEKKKEEKKKEEKKKEEKKKGNCNHALSSLSKLSTPLYLY